MAAWLVAFVFTHLVEVPTAVFLAGGPRGRVALAAFLGTVITHPVFWFVAPSLFTTYWAWVVVCELVIPVVEGVVLWRLVPGLRPSFALSVSFRANALSYLGAHLLQMAGLWPPP